MMKASISVDTQYRTAQLEDHSQQQTLGMACSVVSLLDLRDRYTGGHSSRVAHCVRDTAVQMALRDDEIEDTVLAASLHDIGKIGVPDCVLLKPDGLTDVEFESIRKHPEWGWMALRNVDGFLYASLLVLHHHERFDGTGYPAGLKDSDIPVGSRIIAVADTFDALTTDRPHRAARTPFEAVQELLRCAGSQFDPRVVNSFCASLECGSEGKRLTRTA